MANGAAEAPKREEDLFLPPSIFDSRKEGIKSRGQLIERKIDFLESLAGKASIIGCLEAKTKKREDPVGTEKMVALSAWHRMDRRTREAFRRNCLPDLVQGYEKCVRAFIKESGAGDALVLHVQDSFHRLLLHGVCEFYDLVSVTHTKPRDGKLWKMTVIRKKKSGSQEIPPNITITRFMKMGKDGIL